MNLLPFGRPAGFARALLFAFSALTLPAWAQWTDEKAWQEADVSPPAQFNATRLIEFQVASFSELRFGVVPETVTIGSDGAVRYVLVARSAAGVNNVLYQGLRCDAAQFKTYAVWEEGKGWRAQKGVEWVDWTHHAAGLPARRLAREAFCKGRMANDPVSKMLTELRVGKPYDR